MRLCAVLVLAAVSGLAAADDTVCDIGVTVTYSGDACTAFFDETNTMAEDESCSTQNEVLSYSYDGCFTVTGSASIDFRRARRARRGRKLLRGRKPLFQSVDDVINSVDDIIDQVNNISIDDLVDDDLINTVTNITLDDLVDDDLINTVTNISLDDLVDDDLINTVTNITLDDLVPDDLVDLVTNPSVDDLVPDDVVNTVTNISLDDLVADDLIDAVTNISVDDLVDVADCEVEYVSKGCWDSGAMDCEDVIEQLTDLGADPDTIVCTVTASNPAPTPRPTSCVDCARRRNLLFGYFVSSVCC